MDSGCCQQARQAAGIVSPEFVEILQRKVLECKKESMIWFVANSRYGRPQCWGCPLNGYLILVSRNLRTRWAMGAIWHFLELGNLGYFVDMLFAKIRPQMAEIHKNAFGSYSTMVIQYKPKVKLLFMDMGCPTFLIAKLWINSSISFVISSTPLFFPKPMSLRFLKVKRRFSTHSSPFDYYTWKFATRSAE